MPKRKHYTLTALAEADLRAAKAWSLSRWGKKLTQEYFSDLHNAAEYIGQHHASLRVQDNFATDSDLGHLSNPGALHRVFPSRSSAYCDGRLYSPIP